MVYFIQNMTEMIKENGNAHYSISIAQYFHSTEIQAFPKLLAQLIVYYFC